MTRRLAVLLCALALASACQTPTAPLHYEGACSLTFPRAVREGGQQVTLCYGVCPWHAETFAAEGDALYQALSAPCGTGAP